MGMDAVTPTSTMCPARSLGSGALFLLTWVGGVSPPALGVDGLAVVARRRSGVVLGRTGASSDRELVRTGTVQHKKVYAVFPAFTEACLCLCRLQREGQEGAPAG